MDVNEVHEVLEVVESSLSFMCASRCFKENVG